MIKLAIDFENPGKEWWQSGGQELWDSITEGFDNNDVLLEGMRNGQIDGLTLQDPFDMGYRGVKTAVAVMNGEVM